MVICKHCQVELPEHVRFCGRCGNTVDEETRTPTVREGLAGQPHGEAPMVSASDAGVHAATDDDALTLWTGQAIADAPAQFRSTEEDLSTLPGMQVSADFPPAFFPSDGQQDQQRQGQLGDDARQYAPLQVENLSAEFAFGAINYPSAQAMIDAPAVPQEGAGLGQHGAHHQPQIQHGAHHQPQIQHGVHHQPQGVHGGTAHHAQGAHGAAHHAQGAHGAAQHAQGAHGAAHHAQGAVGHARHLNGCRPSCMTVGITAAVGLVVAASLALLFLYILPGGKQPALDIPASVSPGEFIAVQGSNFSPGLHILITLDTQQKAGKKAGKDDPASLSRADLLGSAQVLTPQLLQQGVPLTVKGDGSFTTTVQADPSWSAGSQHTLYISQQDGSLIVRKQFTIKAGNGALTLCSGNASSATITLGPAAAGQSASISIPFKLCTQGSGQVDWSSSWDTQQAPWLRLMKSGHVQAPQALLLQFSASAASLKVGKYTTTVIFSSLKSSIKITLNVNLIVQDKNTCIQPGTTSLTLAGIPGQGGPVQQSVTISNCGESGDWIAVTTTDDGASWLSADPGNGTLQKGAAQGITVSAVAANLVAGTYTGHVVFGSGSNTRRIDVTFVVTSTPQVKPPCLAVNTGQLNFSAKEQDNDPAAQGVTITNPCGAGSWSATLDQSWLSLSASGGNIGANGSVNLNVQASIAGLAAGTHTGHVTFYPGNATVTVVLNVQAIPCISVQSSPSSISVMDGNTSSNVPARIAFSNGADCGAGAWTAQSDVPWITFTSPASGSINAGANSVITVNINENAVGTGSFAGHITFSPGSGSSVATINLTVYRRLCISATATSLSFTVMAGSTPGSQAFTVSNCANTGTLSVSSITTDSGGSWLHVTGGGSLGAGGSMRFVVTPSAVSLKGTYTGHIYLTITGSDGGTTTIRVDVADNVYILT